MEKNPEFDALIAAYASKRLVLVVGEEFMRAVDRPSLRILAEELIEEIRSSRSFSPAALIPADNLLREGLVSQALLKCQEMIGSELFEAFIGKKLDPSSVRVPEVAWAIAKLDPYLGPVLTTNLDSQLERAFGARRVVRVELPPRDTDVKFILKLNGVIDNPLSWKFLRDETVKGEALREFLSDRPVAFVGMSALHEDATLKELLEIWHAEDAPRFVLEAGTPSSPARRSRFNAMGAHLIEYSNKSGQFEGLVDLFHELMTSMEGVDGGQLEALLPQQDIPQDGGTQDPGPFEFLVPRFTYSHGLMIIWDFALQIRARRRERDAELSTSALLFALVEVGRQRLQEGTANSSRWLFERAHSARFDAFLQEFLTSPFTPQRRPYDEVLSQLSKVRRTPNLINLLHVAESLAEHGSDATELAARHVLGALLAQRKASRVPKSLQRLEEASGRSITLLREEFLEYIRAHHPSEAEAVWRETLLGTPAPLATERLLPGYSPDDTRGEDLLGLRDEIAGFASVIASKDLVPPLSVGLFGSWGSGKSFFIRRLQDEIERLAKRARKEPEGSRFCGAIVPIEFNAWHYAEGNLWASLVEHVFQSLSDHLLDTRSAEKRKVAELFERITASKQLRDESRQAVDTAQTAQQQAEGTLTLKLEEENARASSLRSLLSADLWKQGLIHLSDEDKAQLGEVAVKLGFPNIQRSAQDIKALLAESRSLTGRLKLFASSLLLRKRALRHWVIVALVLAVPPLVAAVCALAKANGVQTLAALIGSTLAWVSSGVAWAKRQVDRASELFATLDKVDTQVSKQLAAEEERHREEITKAEKDLEAAKAGVSEAKQRLEEAEKRLREAEQNLEESRPERRIARLIQERLGSDDYRKHLSVVATVRRDFQRLSELMHPEDPSLHSKYPEAQGLPRIDRIVLYIDDLDRCPPERVVQVLEAVHLLLAFKLFVVVVGVDSRWMVKSLAERYPKLLTEAMNPGATAHDYLEKIFQIPFWLRPMEPNGALRIISELLSPALAPSAPVSPPVPPSPAPPVVPEAAPSAPPSDTPTPLSPPPVPLTPGPQANPLESLSSDVPPQESAERRLDIHHLELEFMQLLSPFVGHSPRRVKRFVNVYRLFKASLPPGDHATYIKRGNSSGDHQPVLVLLALLTGAPHLAPGVLRRLLAKPPDSRVRDFLADWKDTSEPEARVITGVLQAYLRSRGDDVDLRDLISWTPRVSRYSFAVLPQTST